MTLSDCKRLLLARCVAVLITSAALQFLHLYIFVFVANANILQPLRTIASPLWSFCSLGTLVYITPLVGAVVLFCVLHVKHNLADRQYHATFYKWFAHNGRQAAAYFGAHLLLGLVTAWLYASYLPPFYSVVTYDCYGQTCYNGYYFSVLASGVYASLLYFARTYTHRLQFPEPSACAGALSKGEIINKNFQHLKRSYRASLLPTLAFASIYALTLNTALLWTGRVDSAYELLSWLSHVRFLFCIYVLIAQIGSNIGFIKELYAHAFLQELPLVIVKSSLEARRSATIVEALSPEEPYILHCLAARFFYNLCSASTPDRRAEIFELSNPGHNPRNWNSLSQRCLTILKAFTRDLSDCIKKIPAIQQAGEYDPTTSLSRQVHAQKILLRQFNERFGIRSITSPERSSFPPTYTSPTLNVAQKFNAHCEKVSRELSDKCKELFWNCRPLRLLFGEEDDAKTWHLIIHSYPVAWLAQGLAHACAVSITEDKYGIVQSDLPEIISVLLNLKNVLDRLNIMNHRGQFYEQSLKSLRNAIGHSLQIIGNSFHNYLAELLPNASELKQIREMMNTVEP